MKKHQEKIHIIRYKDMISDPDRNIEKLSNFLKIDPAGFPKKMIEDRGNKKYLEFLSREELKIIDEIAGNYLKKYHYV